MRLLSGGNAPWVDEQTFECIQWVVSNVMPIANKRLKRGYQKFWAAPWVWSGFTPRRNIPCMPRCVTVLNFGSSAVKLQWVTFSIEIFPPYVTPSLGRRETTPSWQRTISIPASQVSPKSNRNVLSLPAQNQ